MRSATPLEASVTIIRANSRAGRRCLGARASRSGFARDPRLQRRQSFREPRLLGALHNCGVSSRSTASAWVLTAAMSWIVRLVTIASFSAAPTPRQRRTAGHARAALRQGDASVHEADTLRLGAVEHLPEHNHGASPAAARRCALASTCARRPGCNPICRKRVSNTRDRGGDADIAAERASSCRHRRRPR